MKSMKQIMQELGWQDEPNRKVAEAFIKNLIKADELNGKPTPLKPPYSRAGGQKRTAPRSKKAHPRAGKENLSHQLSFDFFKASGEK